MIDEDRWWRLLSHLLDECGDSIEGERAAVWVFATIHHRLDGPEV